MGKHKQKQSAFLSPDCSAGLTRDAPNRSGPDTDHVAAHRPHLVVLVRVPDEKPQEVEPGAFPDENEV